MNKNPKFSNPRHLERERFSNFVVDLRSQSRPAAALKPTGRKIGESLATSWNKLEKKLKKIRPNLLVPEITSRSFKERLLAGLKTVASGLKDGFSGLQRSKGLLAYRRPLKTGRNNWRKFIKAQTKVFNAAPRLKLQSKKGSLRTERAERAVIWYRSLLAFILVLILIILPFKVLSYFQLFDLKGWEAKIKSSSELALNNLMAAADSVSQSDFKQADFKFQAAGANFLAATDELNKINDTIFYLASFSNDPKVKLAAESKKFLTAGAIASSLGRNLVLATDSLFNNNQADFSSTLDNFLAYGHQAASDAQALKKAVAAVDPDNLPVAYRAKFISLNDQAALLADNLSNFIAAGDKLKEVFGLSRDKRYLLVFQNNAELRASGGFLGSYALVDLRDGKIRNLEVPGGGSYDTEAGFKLKVAAPQPLWLVSPLWYFWDANWWPDWPTTAQNLMWFYEKSDGPSVDGVISVTPTVMERLLEITGPIDLTAEYGLTIDANNFWETVQKITEQKNLQKTNPAAVADLATTSRPVISTLPLKQGLDVNAANKPKKIIGDLLAKILEVLPTKLNKDNLLKIITVFEENMSEKQILFYFTDPNLEAEVAAHNWAGAIQTTPQDYLLVVNTNIAGQKSDRLMSEKIETTSVVSPDGTIINTVVISRTHNGRKNEPLTGVRNVDWLRVYVPLGSELLAAEGFNIPDAQYFKARPEGNIETNPLLAAENAALTDASSGTKIYTEKDKTVFANWVMVDPGQTAVITLQYRLPFNFFTRSQDNNWLKRLNDWLNPAAAQLTAYSLLAQKQPGAKASEFVSHLILPSGLTIFWRHPDDLNGVAGWEINDQLNADKYWSVLVQQNK